MASGRGRTAEGGGWKGVPANGQCCTARGADQLAARYSAMG